MKSGKINNTAPGVFFYYTKGTAPEASFTIKIAQTKDALGNHNSIPFFGVKQAIFYSADCTKSSKGKISSTSGGQVTISVSGATTGQLFIVSVKYTTGTPVGAPTPNPTTVHYDYATKVNNVQVDQDPNGVNLMKK